MASVLERLRRLIALSESPNENEARNAAVLAVRLIREHHVALSLPEAPPAAARRASPKPSPAPVAGQAARKRTPASAKTKRVADVPAEIKSPLGGECVVCGQRYRAGASIFWLESGGGIHPRCFADWTRANI